MKNNFTCDTAELCIRQIALEASFMANMTSAITNIFPDMLESLKTSFHKTENLPVINSGFFSDQSFLLRNVDTFKYLDIAELTTFVPEGFSGNLIEYSKELVIALDHVTTIEKNLLEPFSVYLSTFITNKDSKQSLTDQTRKYKDIEQNRNKLIVGVSKFFKDSSSISKVKLGTVISRNADFRLLFAEGTLVKKKLDNVNIKAMNVTIKTCLDLLNVIIFNAQGSMGGKVSPEAVKNLSMGAYEVAREIEFFSVIYYKALGFVTTVDTTTKRVNNFIKNVPLDD